MRIPPYSPPQRIDRAASPTFANLTLTALAAAGILAADGSGNFGAVSAKTANTVYAGPVSGGVAAPAFRALVIADIPFAGQASGVATLDSGGKIPSAQLPSISITDTFVVVSQAAMLALSAERGDVAIRTDLNKSFVLSTDSPSTLADWKELLTPTDAVLSVAGLTGVISDSGLRTALGLGYFATGTDAANLTGTVAAARLTGASYSFTTPVLGVATATSVAIGGATIGSNALAWTGTANGSGALTLGGVLTLPAGSNSSPSVNFGDTNTGVYRFGSNQIALSFNSSIGIIYEGGTLGQIFASGYGLGFSTGTTVALLDTKITRAGVGGIRLANASTGTADLYAEAANTLALRNGVNAQTFNLYNTWTDASNYERGVMRYSANVLVIGTERAGTGGYRNLQFISDNVGILDANSWLIRAGSGSVIGVLQFGDAGAGNNAYFDSDAVNFRNRDGTNAVTLTRPSAATWQHGAATGSGAAIAQTIQVQGSSGNSAAAALFTIAGSDQTGTTTTGGGVKIRGGNGTSAGGTVEIWTSATSTPAAALVITAAKEAKHLGNVWLDNVLVTGLTPSVSAGLLTKSIIIYDSAGAAITLYGS